jgi:parallel beta-helix repeat protein
MNDDFLNGTMTDTVWTLTNNGNTTAAYDIRLVLRSAEVPEGIKTQLLLYKSYTTPVSRDCQLTQETQNVLIASIPNPRFDEIDDSLVSDPADGSLEHATLWLAPGESARITLRVVDPDKTDTVTFDPVSEVVVAVAPQPVDTESVEAGETTPEVTTTSSIVFLARPTATPIGGYITPPVQVLVQNDDGTPVAGATVTLSLASNAGGATLHGGTATTGADGVATFSTLWLDRLGNGYRLQATAGGRTSNDGGSFDVVPLVVTTTSDAGPGSLRAAIENANRNVGYADTISFAIPGGSVHRIGVASPLPAAADPVTIDATTQPGYAGAPLVELDGQSLPDGTGPPGTGIPGLIITAGASAVRGFAIFSFPGSGVVLSGGSGNVVEGNYLGLTAAGVPVHIAHGEGNGEDGINVLNSSDNRIGGAAAALRNVISANTGNGVFLDGTWRTVVVGNYIGTAPDGTTDFGSFKSGVRVRAGGSNVIGGSNGGEGNVISGHDRHGVSIEDSAGNTVCGDLIGTTAAGDRAMGNDGVGIVVARSTDDVIGGLVPGCRNVIAGGIWGLNANRLTIAGNFIGTNAAGTAALVDSRPGIRLEGCTDSVIGGAATTARNVVGGSQRQGIVLDGSSGARVAGNFVGTDATGTLPIPNGSLGDFAIEAVNGAHDNTIGGTAAEGNLIAFNVGGGVRVGGVTDERNAILSNRLHSNGGLGIDLGFDGVTANDLGDGDTGPNDLLNYPILSSAVSDATQTTASGSVDIGVAGATVNIQFFHNQTCDPTGHGEGQTPVGQTTVTTGASGTATFVASLPGGLNPGFITATTILPPANTTSEFSACRSVTSGGTLSFSVEPAATPIGGYVTPPVEVLVQDESGAALPGATVALSFASNPGGATLHGGTATTNSSGIATFSELWLDRLGGGYRLRATVGAYPAEDSAAFEVTPLVVTTVAGFGAGSLRAAIENANRNAGYADAISFAIPGAGPHTIAPSSPLPVIADALMIDGTTQPAYAGTPMIDLSGQLAGSAQGLVITGVGSTVRGLAINGFQNEGIWLTGGSGNVIQGNFIGTEATGSLARANRDGILITASPDNLIGGTSPADRNVISGNLSMGVRIEQSSSTGNQVVGNFIGTDATGTVALGNGQSGVLIVGAPGNTVGGAASGAGNVISGNGMTGVTLAGTSANTVLGNRIGTDASGTAAIPNQGFGVSLGQSSSDTIGGEAVGAGNLVSGNGGGGVAVGPMTVGAIVAGNRIGTNADGTSAIGNAGEGIYVTGPDTSVMMIKANVVSGNARTGIDIVSGAHHSTLIGNRVGTNAAGSAAIPNGSPSSGVRVSGDAHTNTIGGAGAGEGNLISGNHVGLTLTTTHDNTVQGNRIGTNADGTAAVPNAASGIFLDSVAGGTIGGAVAGQGNLVSGNGECGISVWLTGLSGALIAGNRIGTNAEGTAAVGNTLTGICLRGAATSGNTISGNILSGNGRHGLEILGGPHDNTIVSNKIGTNVTGTGPLGNIQAGVTLSNPGANVIGALTPALGNTIAFNGTSGVAYFEGTAPNFFGANRIHSNGWLGIGLTGDTPTANDPVDSDSGPNDLLNFPVLTSAVGSTAGTTVEGTLNSLPAETFTIQVFSSGACDPSGNGEGEVFLGSTTVVTSSPGGVGTFSLSLPTNLTGQVITATASTSLPMAEETSEFSACRQVAPSVPPTMIVDTFGPGGSFDDETNIVAADGRFATPPTGPGPSTSIRAATKFAVPDGTSYSLSSITLPISFQGPNPGTLRVRLTDDVAGVPGTTTLETLSENENRWPAFQNPFTATTTLNSVSSPRLSGGSSYWLVTELTVFPTDWADYRWFQNGLVSPTLSVLQQQTEGESLPSGGWVGAISSVQPLALRVEGLPVP